MSFPAKRYGLGGCIAAGLAALRIDLKHRLNQGWLRAFGDPGRPGVDPEWIPVRSWYHLKPDPLTRNKVSGEAVAYWYVRVIDPRRKDLLEPESGENGAPSVIGTGLPGRPTSKQLYLAEMQRRAENGELARALASEAKQLAAWLQTVNPDAPGGSQKTIENAIRSEYWRLKNTP